MKEIIASAGITELEADKPGLWFLCPQDAGKLDLRTVNGQTAYLAVAIDGVYFVGFASGTDIEWTKVTRGPAPSPSGPGWLAKAWAKVKGTASWAWPTVRGFAPYLMTAVVTAVLFVALGQGKGCDWKWPDVLPTSGYQGPVPDGPEAMLAELKKHGDGMRVLMIYETADKLSPGQNSAMFAAAVTDYLNAHCAVGPDGKTKEWRRFDKDTPLDKEAQTWRDMMALPRKSLPWVIIKGK